MSDLLNRSYKYTLFLPDECWWLFVYESHLEANIGYESGWYAYRRQPGSKLWIALGRYTELEVLQRVVEHGHRLDDEDRYDLLFFLYLGGLEDFFNAKI